jgi:hypothetical protein
VQAETSKRKCRAAFRLAIASHSRLADTLGSRAGVADEKPLCRQLVQIRLAKSVCWRIWDSLSESRSYQALDKHLPKQQHIQMSERGTYMIGNAGITPKCSYTNQPATIRLTGASLRLDRRAWNTL